jgi:hypothetical protein
MLGVRITHFFAPRFVLSLYKFRENHHFHEPTVQNPFDHSNANSILYNFTGFSLYMIRPKALTQAHVEEISAWLGHFCHFYTYDLSLCTFREKHYIC